MKQVLESEPNLTLRQDECAEIIERTEKLPELSARAEPNTPAVQS